MPDDNAQTPYEQGMGMLKAHHTYREKHHDAIHAKHDAATEAYKHAVQEVLRPTDGKKSKISKGNLKEAKVKGLLAYFEKLGEFDKGLDASWYANLKGDLAEMDTDAKADALTQIYTARHSVESMSTQQRQEFEQYGLHSLDKLIREDDDTPIAYAAISGHLDELAKTHKTQTYQWELGRKAKKKLEFTDEITLATVGKFFDRFTGRGSEYKIKKPATFRAQADISDLVGLYSHFEHGTELSDDVKSRLSIKRKKGKAENN
ncbi:MAG: hypothetical protein ACI8Y7_000232 [Candidatus Woesearchaeota archaeon]|jgi:hypothetical protein